MRVCSLFSCSRYGRCFALFFYLVWMEAAEITYFIFFFWFSFGVYGVGMGCVCGRPGGSRLMDEEKEKMANVNKPTAITTTMFSNSNGLERRPSPIEPKQVAVFKMRWPTESRDGGIMIITDDEEDDAEDDGE